MTPTDAPVPISTTLKVSDLYQAAYVNTRCRLAGTAWHRASPTGRAYATFCFFNQDGRANDALVAYSNEVPVNPVEFVNALRTLRQLVFEGREKNDEGDGQ